MGFLKKGDKKKGQESLAPFLQHQDTTVLTSPLYYHSL